MNRDEFLKEIGGLGQKSADAYQKWREGYTTQLRDVLARVIRVYVKDAEKDGKILRHGQNYVISCAWEKPAPPYKHEATIVDEAVVNFLEAYWEHDMRQRDIDLILTGTVFTVKRHDTLHGFHVCYTG